MAHAVGWGPTVRVPARSPLHRGHTLLGHRPPLFPSHLPTGQQQGLQRSAYSALHLVSQRARVQSRVVARGKTESSGGWSTSGSGPRCVAYVLRILWSKVGMCRGACGRSQCALAPSPRIELSRHALSSDVHLLVLPCEVRSRTMYVFKLSGGLPGCPNQKGAPRI